MSLITFMSTLRDFFICLKYHVAVFLPPPPQQKRDLKQETGPMHGNPNIEKVKHHKI